MSCRNQRNSVHLCSDGGGTRARHHALLQPGQHDGVWLRCAPAGRRLSSGGLALGRLFGSHPVWDLVQPQVHRQHSEERVGEPRRIHSEHHEPAQQRGGTTGERHPLPALCKTLQSLRCSAHCQAVHVQLGVSASCRWSTGRCPQTVAVMASPAPAP